jgi:hypothetical protein
MIEMTCPYCDEVGGLTATHRHLIDAHLEMVETRFEAEEGKMYYLVPCPFCGLKYRHRVKPRRRDPGFLAAFRAEIGMVAFDQLLYHVLQKHPSQVGVNPADLEIDPDADTRFEA